MNLAEARALVNSLESSKRDRDHDLIRLARILSLAARVEPQMVRRARLALLPWAEAGLEADLWFSSLLQARSPLALVFLPEVVVALREGFAADQDLLRSARDMVIRYFHRPGTTPPIIIREEDLVWWGLADNTDAPARINELLNSLILTTNWDKERAMGLAQWWLQTLPQLPRKVLQSPASTNMTRIAATTLGQFAPDDASPSTQAGSGFDLDMPTPTSDVEVWVRLLQTGLEFSTNPLPGASPDPIRLPRFDTLFVQVEWQEKRVKRRQGVALSTSQPARLQAPPVKFTISTMGGAIYTLLPQGPAETPRPAVTYNALLIGIDAYPEGFSNLGGCVNDIDAIQRILLDESGIGVPPEQIRVHRLASPLHDSASTSRLAGETQAPTRANIIAALRSLADTVVGPDDRVLIYYAGYGTQGQVEGTPVWHEALVAGDGQLMYDVEFNALIAGINARTDEVTVILDCCFSGGATRGSYAVASRQARFLQQGTTLGPGPDPTLLTSLGPGPDTNLSVGQNLSGHVLVGQSSNILALSACRAEEQAYEMEVDGQQHGLLSASLAAVLAETGPTGRSSLRWVDLFPQILDRVTTLASDQHPMLFGYSERRVFGGTWTIRDPGFPVELDPDGTYRIRAGSLLGVTVGAVIAVYGSTPAVFPPLGSLEDTNARLGVLNVVRADRASASARPDGEVFTLPPGARARLIQPGVGQSLRVRLETMDEKVVADLETSPALHLLTPREGDVEVVVRGTVGEGWVIGNSVERQVARVPPGDIPTLKFALEAYGRYNSVLRLAYSINDPQLAGVLQVFLLDARNLPPDAAGAAQVLDNLPEAPRNERRIYALPVGFPVFVQVHNSAQRANFVPSELYVTALNCTATGKVEYLGSTAVPPHARRVFPEGGPRPFRASPLPLEVGSMVDRLVVVATTGAPLNLSALAIDQTLQDFVDGHVGTRGFREDTISPGASSQVNLATALIIPFEIEQSRPDNSPVPPPVEGEVSQEEVNQTLQALIDDVLTLRRMSREDPSAADDLIVRFLQANREVLMEYIRIAYEELSEQQRASLAASHRELDQSAVSPSFREIAEGTVRRADNYNRSYLKADWDDRLNMLDRTLRFARYAPSASSREQPPAHRLSEFTDAGSASDPSSAEPTGENSDEFRGTSRRQAKLSISDAPVETFGDLQDLLNSLPTNRQMINHSPPIEVTADSDRTMEENRNVRVRAFLYAVSRQAGNDFTLIVGRAPGLTPERYMIMELSGLPPHNSPAYGTLKAARDSFKTSFGANLPDRNSYVFYDPPIPVEIQGSLLFAIQHKDGPRPGPAPLRNNISTLWRVQPVTGIVFEPTDVARTQSEDPEQLISKDVSRGPAQSTESGSLQTDEQSSTFAHSTDTPPQTGQSGTEPVSGANKKQSSRSSRRRSASRRICEATATTGGLYVETYCGRGSSRLCELSTGTSGFHVVKIQNLGAYQVQIKCTGRIEGTPPLVKYDSPNPNETDYEWNSSKVLGPNEKYSFQPVAIRAISTGTGTVRTTITFSTPGSGSEQPARVIDLMFNVDVALQQPAT